jgi:hypothetical protein
MGGGLFGDQNQQEGEKQNERMKGVVNRIKVFHT